MLPRFKKGLNGTSLREDRFVLGEGGGGGAQIDGIPMA